MSESENEDTSKEVQIEEDSEDHSHSHDDHSGVPIPSQPWNTKQSTNPTNKIQIKIKKDIPTKSPILNANDKLANNGSSNGNAKPNEDDSISTIKGNKLTTNIVVSYHKIGCSEGTCEGCSEQDESPEQSTTMVTSKSGTNSTSPEIARHSEAQDESRSYKSSTSGLFNLDDPNAFNGSGLSIYRDRFRDTYAQNNSNNTSFNKSKGSKTSPVELTSSESENAEDDAIPNGRKQNYKKKTKDQANGSKGEGDVESNKSSEIGHNRKATGTRTDITDIEPQNNVSVSNDKGKDSNGNEQAEIDRNDFETIHDNAYGYGATIHESDIGANGRHRLADDSSELNSIRSPVSNVRSTKTSTPLAASNVTPGAFAKLFHNEKHNLKGKNANKANGKSPQESSNGNGNLTKNEEDNLQDSLKLLSPEVRIKRLDSLRKKCPIGRRHDALVSYTLKTLIEMGDPEGRMILVPNKNVRGAEHWKIYKLAILDDIKTKFAVCTHCVKEKSEMQEASVCKIQGGGNFARHMLVIEKRKTTPMDMNDETMEQEERHTRSTRMKHKPLQFDVYPMNKKDKSINMKYFSCTKKLSKRHRKQLIQACLDFVTLDIRPFRAIRGTGLMRYSNALIEMTLECGRWSPEKMLPHHSTLSKNAKFRAINTSELLKAVLAKVETVNVIADHWQDIRNGYMFIGVAVCFCFPNTINMMCPTIGVFQVERENAETTITKLKEIYLAYGIIDKILYAVSDAGGGLKVAMQELHHNRWGHCSGHLSNICLKNTIHKCLSPEHVISDLLDEAEVNIASKKSRSSDGAVSSMNGITRASQTKTNEQQVFSTYATMADDSEEFPQYYENVRQLPSSQLVNNDSDEEDAEVGEGYDPNFFNVEDLQPLTSKYAGKRKRPDQDIFQEEYDDWVKISTQIKTCKELVTKVKSKHIQKDFEPSLKQSIETRWDSTHRCIESIVKNESNIINCSDNEIKPLALTLDFGILKELEGYLCAYKEERMLLAYEDKPTLSRVVAMKQMYIELAEASQNLLSRATRTRYANFIRERFGIYRLHVVAAYLDPVVMFGHACSNFDNLFAGESKTLHYGSGSLIAQEELRYVVDLMNKQKTKVNNSTMPQNEVNNGDNSRLMKSIGKRYFDMIIRNREVQINLTTLENETSETYDALQGEMKDYEAKMNLGPKYLEDAADDLLTFWKTRRGNYPILYKCALAVLSCPSSQNKVERLFSICMLTCSHLRVNLLPNTTSSLVMNHSVISIEKRMKEMNISIEEVLGEEGMKELTKKQKEAMQLTTGLTNDDSGSEGDADVDV